MGVIEVTTRLEKLEMNTQLDVKKDHAARVKVDMRRNEDDGTWRPARAVMAGWKERSNRDDIIKDTQRWLNDHPEIEALRQALTACASTATSRR